MSAPYSEPSNEQLANFMTVYARRMPQFQHLHVNPAILEHLIEKHPEFRATALNKHREFQDNVNALQVKIQQGLLPCEYIRPNGKHCPNYNTPGSHFCGLHQDEEMRVQDELGQ